MESHLYLSLIPEALILSQLPPDKFGTYLATGSKRQIEGPAVFFEVDQTADLSGFRMDEAGPAACFTATGLPASRSTWRYSTCCRACRSRHCAGFI